MTTTTHPIPFAIQGHPEAIEIDILEHAGPVDILVAVRAHTGRDDLCELSWEDEDEALAEAERVIETLRENFRLLHASTGQMIEVTLSYDGRHAKRAFRSNTTIRRVIAWAISPEGFRLEGTPAEFKVKVGDRVLPPESHVGQASEHCTLAGTLVHSIKPQG